MTNFRLFQTKKVADDSFKFDENGRKLSIRVENTVGKGEIARYEQFLLFPQCFLKACFSGASKGVVWEWVNCFNVCCLFERIENILEREIMQVSSIFSLSNIFLTLYLTCQFWALLIQQQIKI